MGELVEVWPDPRIERLEEQLARARRERDEYADEVHRLNGVVRLQTSAATSAAASAYTAIERLQFWEALVNAAAEWAGETKRDRREELAMQLYDLALAEHARRSNAS